MKKIFFLVVMLFCIPMSVSAATVPEEPPTVAPVKELGPTELLQLAMEYYRADMFVNAIKFFQKSIGTQQLNNSGRTLCYFNIAYAHFKLGNIQREASAWFAFLTIANDVLDDDNNLRFIADFMLISRMKFAVERLEVIWEASKTASLPK